MTGVQQSREKRLSAAILQAIALTHTALLTYYLLTAQWLYAVGAGIVVVIVSTFALRLAEEAGIQWPTGEMEEEDGTV